jgi:antitoxin CcdA
MMRTDSALKRPTNLSLNAKVLDMARELGMNISQTVDALLAEEVQRRYYNARVEREGLPLGKYRTFLKGR